MNRSDLINELKNQTSLSRKDSEKFVETFFGSISETLSKNQRVEIRGFGSFKVKTRKARIARNPRTGERVEVPKKEVPYFKASRELIKLVDSA